MSQTYSIKCPKCAAPLMLLGGGRVETITCAYCKSVIDLNDNYRILSVFKNASRPNTPFKIGMQGTIHGVDYTLIGVVTYQSTAYPQEQWHEYLLFSPLYGYAWLTYERGHLTFSRRTRHFPPLLWGEIPLRSSIDVHGKHYRFYSQYEASITFVEGELTWVAKKGDRSSFIDLIAPPYGISAEKNKQEIEFYRSEYLPSEALYAAFGIPQEEQPRASGFNPLKPYSRPILESLTRVGIVTLVLIVLVMIGLQFEGKGNTILQTQVSNKSPLNQAITINTTKYLLAMELSSDKPAYLNNFTLTLSHNAKPLFRLDKNNGYIMNAQGVIDAKLSSWETNAKKVVAYLKINQTGTYDLTITPLTPQTLSTLKVEIQEGVSRSTYFVYLALLIVGILLYAMISYLRYKSKLNENSDANSFSLSLDLQTIFWILLITFFIYLDVATG
ncbi:MAG TPA: DUF4178 domain-containing protein [Campylobacterales bacterium]|nr:DUF4178 domain-containing protein [Campylobacterales bacterium]